MLATIHPELDQSPELTPDDVTKYQELIGIVRWATEIGRVDVVHEVSILSQYQAIPRQGHMEQLLRVFAFWKHKDRLSIYMDPRTPNVDYSGFISNKDEFKAYYKDAEEPMPHKMPVPRGLMVWITAYVDASHAANRKTRRSHTGYIIFLNRGPVL